MSAPPGRSEESWDEPQRRQLSARARAGLVVAVTVVIAGGVTGGALATRSNLPPLEKAPKPVLGRSLRPLVVYERADPLMATHPKVGAGERTLTPLTGTRPVVVLRKPTISLHVEYARVAPDAIGGWRIELVASEGTFFNGETMYGHTYFTLIGHKAVPLVPLYELNGPAITSADATQFLLGTAAPTDWPTKAVALATARSLTTSVTVAECTAAQIAKYRCT